MYSPLKQSPDIPLVNYGPVNCGKCQALLNPYWSLQPQFLLLFLIVSQVDLNTKMWACPFCTTRNKLPGYYLGPTLTIVPSH